MVTGGAGCIGAWVIARLVRDGEPALAYDLSDDRRRLLLDEDEAASVPWHIGDIADLESLESIADAHDVGAIVHLAALQVPFCRADPSAGARANVVGHVNILEVARRRALKRVVYTSSIAALPLAGRTTPSPPYGVYKKADEGTAEVYWRDRSVPGVGLRPHTVHGIGRDRGATSAATVAILSAVAAQPFTIPFTGGLQMHHAADVADIILRCAAREVAAAPVFDIGEPPTSVADIIAVIAEAVPGAVIGIGDGPLPFPHDRSDQALPDLIGEFDHTPLAQGIADTAAASRPLLERGLVSL